MPTDSRKLVETQEVRLRPTAMMEATPCRVISLFLLLATEETPSREQVRPVMLDTVRRRGQTRKWEVRREKR